MSRSLNPREKRLLASCVLVILLVVNFIAFKIYFSKSKRLKDSIASLEDQSNANNALLKERPFWEKRMNWLDKAMPYTNSAGRSQGQLLEELQNSSLDAELKISGQTLLESVALNSDLATAKPEEKAVCNEVAVNVKLRGDQDKMLRWLLTLQSPEKFQAIKAFELELDSKAKEKVPQAQCNLTLARWFNPNAPPDATPEPAPQPAPAAAEEPANPLVSPLDSIAAPPEPKP